MTTMQTDNAKALFQEIAKIPEEKQARYITAMRMLLLGGRLAEQPCGEERRQTGRERVGA